MTIQIPQNTAAPVVIPDFITGADEPLTLCCFVKVGGWNSSGTEGFPLLQLGDTTDGFMLSLQGAAASRSVRSSVFAGGSSAAAGYEAFSEASAFVDIWKPVAAVFAGGTLRSVFVLDELGAFQSSINTYSRAVGTADTLTLFPAAWANGVISVDHIQVYQSALTQAQFEEYASTGGVAALTPYSDWDATTDWGAGDITDDGSSATDFTPHSSWVFTDDNPLSSANDAPVVNDQTFSVADSASIGTVIGTVVATDSDGTVDSYAISGSTLAIDSSGQITLADNAGIVAGTPITATATVTDNGGGTDTATVTVNVTNAVLTDTLLDAESSNAAIANETSLTIHVYDTDGGTELYSTASATTDGSGVFVVDDDAIGAIDDTVFVVIKRSNGQTACGTMTVVDGAA